MAATIALLRRSRAMRASAAVVEPRRIAVENSRGSGNGAMAAGALIVHSFEAGDAACVGVMPMPCGKERVHLRAVDPLGGAAAVGSASAIAAVTARSFIGMASDGVGWEAGNGAERSHGSGSRALQSFANASAGGIDERKILTGSGAGYGPCSAGPTSHALLDAAAGLAGSPARLQGGATGSAAAADARRSPTADALAEALERRRAVVCGHLMSCAATACVELQRGALLGSGAPACPSDTPSVAAASSSVARCGAILRQRPASLRALHARRCRSCMRRNLTGILTAPNAAPLRLLATGALRERGLSMWFRKTSSAATLLPRVEVLPLDRDISAASGAAVPPPQSDAHAGLLVCALAHVRAALRVRSVRSDGIDGGASDCCGAREAEITARIPVAVRLCNPLDAAVVVALVALIGRDGSEAAPPAAASAPAPCATWPTLPATLIFDASGDGAFDSATDGIDDAPPAASVPAAGFEGGSGAAALLRAIRGASAAGSAPSTDAAAPAALPHAASVVVAALGAFDEIGLCEPMTRAEDEAAALRAAVELMDANSAAAGAPCAVRITRMLARDGAPAVLRRWRHVLTLRATLSVALPPGVCAAVAAGTLAGVTLRACSAMAVLLPSAPLAQRAGTLVPSPAAAAAACVLESGLILELPLPLIDV